MERMMTNRRKVLVSSIATFASGAMLFWALAGPQALQGCVNAPEYSTAYQQSQDQLTRLRLTLSANTSCILGYTERRSGILIVLVTGILAYVTFGLWRSTRDMARDTKEFSAIQSAKMQAAVEEATRSADAASKGANAAMLQAKAIIHLERPMMHVTAMGVVGLLGGPDDAPGLNRSPRFFLNINFRNFGRGPAIISRLGFGSAVGTAPPIKPEYEEVGVGIDANAIVLPGHEYLRHRAISFPIVHAEHAAINEMTASFWVWGRLVYNDFLGGVTEHGFIARYQQDIQTPKGGVPARFNFAEYGEYAFTRYHPPSGDGKGA